MWKATPNCHLCEIQQIKLCHHILYILNLNLWMGQTQIAYIHLTVGWIDLDRTIHGPLQQTRWKLTSICPPVWHSVSSHVDHGVSGHRTIQNCSQCHTPHSSFGQKCVQPTKNQVTHNCEEINVRENPGKSIGKENFVDAFLQFYKILTVINALKSSIL